MTDCIECKKGYKFSAVGERGMCYKDANYTVDSSEDDSLSVVDWSFWLKIAAGIAAVLGVVIIILICYARRRPRKDPEVELQPTRAFKHTQLP